MFFFFNLFYLPNTNTRLNTRFGAAIVTTLSFKTITFFNLKGSEVTAVTSFNGRAEERELSFEYGDLIKLVDIVSKDPQWAFAELKGKQGFIPLSFVKPKSITMQ